MKKLILYIIICLFTQHWCLAQTRISGKVLAADDNQPLPGASIKIKGSAAGVSADSIGNFNLVITEGESLIVSYLGYLEKEVFWYSTNTFGLIIRLEPDFKKLKEVVVSTGYQDLLKERSTGSFSKISNEVLESRVSTDILSRLEGLTSSLSFDKRDGLQSPMSIRGRSTILSNNEPLVVVDNFPYDGDLRNINPNDVESVTVLKDASAAAIWGARAGHGVIVINTKRGREGAARVEVQTNLSIGERPDLFYDQNFLGSSDFIDVEAALFERNFYSADEKSVARPALSPAVEIMIAKRDGTLSGAEADQQLAGLRQLDVRQDFDRYVYRNTVKQQHALSIAGGGAQHQYYFSAGYDQNFEQVQGFQNDRLTLTTFNSFKPFKKLELGAGLSFNQFTRKEHNIQFGDVTSGGSRAALYPYARLKDDSGNNLPIIRDYSTAYAQSAESRGLLNWQFVPLDEIGLANNQNTIADLRVNTSLKYTLLQSLNVEGRYQYLALSENQESLFDKDTYFVRNMVNQFTQVNGARPVPYAEIVNRNRGTTDSHSGRLQLNFNKAWNTRHHLTAIAGAEVRQTHAVKDGYRWYGYDSETLTVQPVDLISTFNLNPSRTGKIPQYGDAGDLIDRHISEYANATYSYNKRYVVSASARKDASNLFGVKTNQKWVPLWSMGAGWTLSDEPFYKSGLIPYLKLRMSYGYNGNINKSATAYSTALYTSDGITGLPRAIIRTPPDPQLRWEKVAIFNTGIDFELRNRRIAGSIEYYTKRGTDQIGNVPLDPTTGFFVDTRYSTTRNGASISGSGIDAELTSRILEGAFKWQSNLLFSYTKDKVTDYDFEHPINSYLLSAPPLLGKPVNSLYSYKWAGLDASGDPMVYINGEARKDYAAMNSARTMDDLVWQGTTLAPFFGALRNTFSWKGFSTSFSINYKFGHVFRKSSISYYDLYSSWIGHQDYRLRWQNPGDEKFTNVPAMPQGLIANRDSYYLNSDVLVERGDHIRLQDISLRFTPKLSGFKRFPVRDLSMMIFAQNLGILWRANKSGIDPDYSLAPMLPSRTISFGIKTTL